MQQQPGLCIYCSAPLQAGAGFCGYCGKQQTASQIKKPSANPEYSEAYQQPTGQGEVYRLPTGLGASAIQVAPGQPAFAVQPLMVPLLQQQRTSAFAAASLVLGIVGIILAIIDMMINIWDAVSAIYNGSHSGTTLFFLLIVALFCWTPTLLAFIFGLIARGKIHQDGGRTQGLGFAHAGIILGAVGLGMLLLSILLYLLTLLP